MVPIVWIGHTTSPLPRECSTTELYGHIVKRGDCCGAGEGNRTLVVSLEGFCSTIELHPQQPRRIVTPRYINPASLLLAIQSLWWRGMDSNHRRRKPTDLQSAPFSHSGTPP